MLTRQLRRCLQRGWSYARPVTGFWRAWGRRQKQDLLTLAGLAGGALGAHRRRRSRAHARTLVAALLQRALEPLEPRMLMLTLTWDGGTGGTWNASNHNWIEQGQSGDVAWIVGADALFPSAATVNVSGSVTANNVSFTGTGQYTINAVANTSAHVDSAAVSVATGATATINAPASGISEKQGSGTLVLTDYWYAGADVQARHVASGRHVRSGL